VKYFNISDIHLSIPSDFREKVRGECVVKVFLIYCILYLLCCFAVYLFMNINVHK